MTTPAPAVPAAAAGAAGKPADDALAALGLTTGTENPLRRKQPASAVLGKVLCFDAQGQRIGQWGGTVCFLSKEKGKGPCLVVRKACDTKIGRGSFFNLGGMQKVLGKHTADGNMTLFFNTTPTGLKGKTCSILIEASKEQKDRQNLDTMHGILSNVSRWNEIEKNLSAFFARVDGRGRPSNRDLLENLDENPDFRLREPQLAPEDEDRGLEALEGAADPTEPENEGSTGNAVDGADQHRQEEEEKERRQQEEAELALAEQRRAEEEERRLQQEAEEEAQRQRKAEGEAAAQHQIVFERYQSEVEARGGKITFGGDGFMYVEAAHEGANLEDVPEFETIQSQVLQELSSQKQTAEAGDDLNAAQILAAPTANTLGETTLDLDAYRKAVEAAEARPTTIVQPELEGFEDDSKALAAETAALQAQMGELPDTTFSVDAAGGYADPSGGMMGGNFEEEEGFVGSGVMEQTNFLSPALGGGKPAAATSSTPLDDATNVDATLATSRTKRNRLTLIDEE